MAKPHQSLMNLLDELDPFERDKLLDFVYFTFGVEMFDFPTEDEIIASRYNQFKKNCDQLPLSNGTLHCSRNSSRSIEHL